MGRMQFVLGRAGTGKTRFCIEAVSRGLRGSPLSGPWQIVLVPEQATYQMERTLATFDEVPGFIRARVVSFVSLAREARADFAPATRRVMLESSRLMVMRQLISRVHGRLRYWRNVPPEEISSSLLRLMGEMVQADLTVDALTETAEALRSGGTDERLLADKLHDIVVLLEEYRELSLVDLEDPAKYLEEYRRLVTQLDWLEGASVYVDGFSGFTGQEYSALAATMERAAATYITLAIDPEKLEARGGLLEWDMFSSVRTTYGRLLEIARTHGLKVDDPVILTDPRSKRFAGRPTLAALEDLLIDPTRPARPMVVEDLEVVRAADRAQEVRLAAARILDLVRERGWRFEEVSVVVRELADYESYIRDVFGEYEIPYFLDVRRPVSRSPVARLILGALGAVVSGYRTASVLRYLKSGLTAASVDQIAQIENYVLAHGIDGLRWHKPWRAKPLLVGPDDVDYEAAALLDLEGLNRQREALIGPLQRLEERLGYDGDDGKKYDVGTLLTALVEFIRDVGADRQLTALCTDLSNDGNEVSIQVHRQMWDRLKEMFIQLNLSFSGEELAARDLLRIIEDSFNELTVGVVPSLMDQVLIGSIERTRHPSVKATFVLGFNEGQFPTTAQEDYMLTEAERARLDWPDLARPANVEEHYAKEQYLAYIALTRASDFLWISVIEHDVRGRAQYPSRYLERIERLTGPTRVQRTGADMLASGRAGTPVTLRSLASAVVEALDVGVHDGREDFWLTLAAGLLEREAGRALLSRYIGVYMGENKPTLSAELAAAVYGSRMTFLQIESFYQCPFQHFSQHGLKVRSRPMFRLEPVDLGQFRHAVMKAVWDQARQADPAERERPQFAEEAVNEAIDQRLAQMPGHVIVSTARNRFILQRMREELTWAFRWQLRNAAMGKLFPKLLEQDFLVELAGSGMQLSGRVDRLDEGTAGDTRWVMVLDYKSGNTRLDFTDWYAGVQIQLPGYMLAVVRLDGPEFAVLRPAAPAAAVYVPLRPAELTGADGLELAELFAASGLVNQDAIDVLIDRERSVGREYGFTLGKNGQPTYVERSGLVNSAEFEAILRHTEKLVRDAATQIAAGNVKVEPYRKRRTSACPNCDYYSVCRFDPQVNRYRHFAAMKKSEVLEALDGDD
ncbi:MAG: hypothetical protein GXY33_13505 [Phycisphaerae bacterium]|nr:hypothetical protein [Phycisphaerae bacterium]